MIKTKSLLKYSSILFLFLFAPEIFAALFDPPPTDRSMILLGGIFAKVGPLFPSGSNPVLADVVQKINVLALSLAVVIVSYMGIVSTVSTAQEGQVMGKKWASIWIPMRSMLGILLMVPIPGSGYSLIQVFVMWFIIQGIGAADQIWNIVLDNMKAGISVATGITVSEGQKDQLRIHARKLPIDLLNSATCMETMKILISGNATDNNGNPITPSSFTQSGELRISSYPTKPTLTKTPDPTSVNSTMYTYSGSFSIGDKLANDISSELCGRHNITASVSTKEIASESLAKKLAKDAYDKKMRTIGAMFAILRPAASSIATERVQPRDDTNRLKMEPLSPSGYFKLSFDAYVSGFSDIIKPTTISKEKFTIDTIDKSSLQSAVGSAATGLADLIDDPVERFKADIIVLKQEGWVAAASTYFILSTRISQTLLPTAHEAPTIQPNPYASGADTVPKCIIKNNCTRNVANAPGNDMNLLNRFLSRQEMDYIGARLFDADTYQKVEIGVMEKGSRQTLGLGSGGAGSGGAIRPIANLINRATQKLLDVMMMGVESTAIGRTAVQIGAKAKPRVIGPPPGKEASVRKGAEIMRTTSGGDPLLNIAQFGGDLMLGVEIAWILFILVTAGLSSMATCAAQSPTFATFFSILLSVGSVTMAVCLALWTLGATLSIYLPMIPYMIFTLGTISWIILVIEAVIAAPLLALALVTPSQDELGKIMTGLQLLVGIFLRPALMIVGFIIAARLIRVVIQLVNFGMADAFGTITDTSSMFSGLPAMFFYGGFIIAITNKCFTLIHVLPDQILRWIGVTPERTDISAEMAGAKGGMEAGAGAVKGAMAGAATAVSKHGADKLKEGLEGGRGGGGGGAVGGGGKTGLR